MSRIPEILKDHRIESLFEGLNRRVPSTTEAVGTRMRTLAGPDRRI